MNTYQRHRFPPDIISYAVWLWCIKFGALYLKRLSRKHRGYGDTFYIDEVFVKINSKQHYLWPAVDQDGEVVDVFLQAKRDGAAAGLPPLKPRTAPIPGPSVNPAPALQPSVISSCDSTGCWDNLGGRYNKGAGTTHIKTDGKVCQLVGGMMQCN